MAIDPPRYDEEGNINVTFHANPKKNSFKNQKGPIKECKTPRGIKGQRSFAVSPYYQDNLQVDKEGKQFLFFYRLSVPKLLMLAILDIFLLLALNYFYPSTFSEIVNYFSPYSSTPFDILSDRNSNMPEGISI